MRAKVAIFLFGLTIGMWADALLVELNSTATVYEWVVGDSVKMLQPIEDVDEDVDEERPGPDWLEQHTPRFRPA